MKIMKAVVARGLNDYAVEEVTLDPPKADEVLVKIKATGICHSDLSVINGPPEQLVIRQAKTRLLAEVPVPPELEGVDMNPGKRSESKRPDWLTKTKIVE